MKFEEALQELRKGKKIKRLSNQFCSEYYSNKGDEDQSDIMMLHHILADDWEVLKEPGKTLPEVFEAFKEGKKIRRKSWDESFPHSYLDNDYGNLFIHTDDLLAEDWEIIDE